MKILITGGLGYIGSYLTDYLDGHDVTVVDNLYTQRYCSLFNRKQKFEFIEKDFSKLDINFIKNFDFVIHLAAIANAAISHQQKELIYLNNISYTKEFIDKCQTVNTKFIFPSSTSVYGVATDIVHEGDPKFINPQSVYAKSKIEIEKYLTKKQLEYVILRFGTVCGVSPGIRFQTCINKFCYQAVLNQPLTVWKQNIDMVRPYLCLSDISLTINYILNNWINFKYDTFNVLTNNLSVRNIIEIINQIIPVNINYTDCPLLNQYSYNVSKLKIEKLGIRFQGSILQDIQKEVNLLCTKQS